MDFEKVLDTWDSMQKDKARHARTAHGQKEMPVAQSKQEALSSRPSAASRKAKLVSPDTSRKAKSSSPAASRNTKSSPPAKPSPSRAYSSVREIQEKWIHNHLTPDKDAIADEEAVQRKMLSVRYIKSMEPDETLDLHGYKQKEAWDRLSLFIDDCIRRGAHKVLIIHGKGIHAADSEGVLTGVARSFIEMDSRCGRSGHPDKRHGGSGATWVILKR